MNQKNTIDVDINVNALMEGHALYPAVISITKARRVCRKLLRLHNGSDQTKVYCELIQIGAKAFTEDNS